MQADQLINDIPMSVAVRAFEGTSFSPDKRAASYRDDYAQTMAADYEDFKRHAEKGGTLEKLDEAFARYRAGYAGRYRAWPHSHSRCTSWMITGSSNFPTQAMQRVEGEGVLLEEGPPANRLRLFFDEKPDAGTRERLKQGGPRWAPSIGAWQAYINCRTLEVARSFVGDSAQQGEPC